MPFFSFSHLDYYLPRLNYTQKVNVILEGAFLREDFNNETVHFVSVEIQTTKSFLVNDTEIISYYVSF